ncbi:MAG: hypothetical protein NVS1B2_18430 [Vulcanimicrobiaceae bacterium]
MAEVACEGDSIARRTIGHRRADAGERSRFSRRAVQAAAPDVNGRVRGRSGKGRGVEGRCEGGRRLRFDDREIAVGNQCYDVRRYARRVPETDGKRSEDGDVLGGKDAHRRCVDGDDRARTDAVGLRARGPNNDAAVVESRRGGR